MRVGFTQKRCPKCNGNVFIEKDNDCNVSQDYDSWYEWCLQCGYTQKLKSSIVLAQESDVATVQREPVPV